MQAKLSGFAAAALLAAVALAAPARAQTGGTAAATGATSGTTSGPAVGSPATLGTGGVTASTPHQTETVRNRGGATVTGEQQGQAGGTSQTVRPGASDAGAGVSKPPR